MPRTLLGTRIRERRKSIGLNQKTLAKAAGISASYLNLIEHNKRGIAGKTLSSLATALELEVSALSEGLDQSLIARVKKALLNSGESLQRTEEFTARFPSFARMIARLQDKVDQQEEDFAALADQLQSDPFFAEAMHLMLSNITTIRSTADILATATDLPKPVANKFTKNLQEEGERLAKTVIDVLAHFEPESGKKETPSDYSAYETLLETNGYFLEKIENNSERIEDCLASMDLKQNEKNTTRISLQAYKSMADLMPIMNFLEVAKRETFDPLSIAMQLNLDLPTIFFRMAHLPKDHGAPRFGLLQCDGSGAVLYRKQLNSFSLPRFGGACPLWPVYRSLAQPLQPIVALMDMPTGERFYSYSLSYPIGQQLVGMPAQLESMMLITPDYQSIKSAIPNAIPQLHVGLQCTVCPRDQCSSRRTAYLLGA